MTDDWIQFDVAAAESLTAIDASLHLLAGSGQQGCLCISDTVTNPKQFVSIPGFHFFQKTFGLAKFVSQTHGRSPYPPGVGKKNASENQRIELIFPPGSEW
jgi:hypothetical protein